MIKIHAFQHVPFETPGNIERWIKNKKHELNFTRFYENDPLPSISSFDWLLVMGGPMSIHDEERFGWLIKEKEFIKAAIENDKVVIGICLGAQLIADALGANVFENEHKEIGWFTIKTSIHSTDHDLFSSLPRALNVFHWHGETFDLPENALLLAESEACKNQLFVWNEKVIGLQFHLEITESLIKEMILNFKNQLKKDKFVQTEEEILDRSDLVQQCNILMETFLNNLGNKFGSDV